MSGHPNNRRLQVASINQNIYSARIHPNLPMLVIVLSFLSWTRGRGPRVKLQVLHEWSQIDISSFSIPNRLHPLRPSVMEDKTKGKGSIRNTQLEHLWIPCCWILATFQAFFPVTRSSNLHLTLAYVIHVSGVFQFPVPILSLSSWLDSASE